MTRDQDDDALRWEGDDDPTLAPGWKRVGSAASATDVSTGDEAEGSADAADGADADANSDPDEATAGRRQTGSVELVVFGVLAGVYLLYTVGWLLTAVRTTTPGTSIVADAMYQLGLWLSVLAPALWFGLVYAVVAKPARRILWLVIGAVVLVPLPFVLGVTA
jgi:hypothetical protein